MFLVFKNSTLIGSFIVVNDRAITLKTRNYKKPVFNIIVNFVENTNDFDLNTSIRLLIDSIKDIGLKINTVYLFEKGNENFVKHFVNKGFISLSSDYFRLKITCFSNKYKGSSIFIKDVF